MKLFVGRDVKNAHIHIRNLASLKMLCREYPQLIKTKVSTCPHQLRFCFDIVSFLFGASTQRIKRMGRATKKTLTEKVNIVTCTPYFNQLLQILQNINVLDSDFHFFLSLLGLWSKHRAKYVHHHLNTDNCSLLWLIA